MEKIKQTAIVTGAARGIGRGCALELAKAGFNIVVHDYIDDKSRECADNTVKEIQALGADAITYHSDISDISDHANLFKAALDKWGRLDCLVSNAGVSVRNRGDILDVTEESFDRCIAVNTKAPFFLIQRCAKIFLDAKSDGSFKSIIVMTSSNAEMASINRSEYCVSKRASTMTARLFALRLAEAGIGVYEIRPGLIMTDMTAPSKEKYDRLIAEGMVPQKRWGYPVDIGRNVAAMAQGLLPYTCALAVPIDGGMSIPNY